MTNLLLPLRRRQNLKRDNALALSVRLCVRVNRFSATLQTHLDFKEIRYLSIPKGDARILDLFLRKFRNSWLNLNIIIFKTTEDILLKLNI